LHNKGSAFHDASVIWGLFGGATQEGPALPLPAASRQTGQ